MYNDQTSPSEEACIKWVQAVMIMCLNWERFDCCWVVFVAEREEKSVNARVKSKKAEIIHSQIYSLIPPHQTTTAERSESLNERIKLV